MQIRDFQNKVFILYSPGFNLSCGGFADNLWIDGFGKLFRLNEFFPEQSFFDSQIRENENVWFIRKKKIPGRCLVQI